MVIDVPGKVDETTLATLVLLKLSVTSEVSNVMSVTPEECNVTSVTSEVFNVTSVTSEAFTVTTVVSKAKSVTSVVFNATPVTSVVIQAVGETSLVTSSLEVVDDSALLPAGDVLSVESSGLETGDVRDANASSVGDVKGYSDVTVGMVVPAETVAAATVKKMAFAKTNTFILDTVVVFQLNWLFNLK